MSWTKISALKRLVTRAIKEDATHCWFSEMKLTDEEELALDKYIKEKKFPIVIYAKNITSSRPQRTWGGLPEWFRPSGPMNTFQASPNETGCFIFVWLDVEVKEEKIKSFIETAFEASLRGYNRNLYLNGKLNKSIDDVKEES